MSNVEKDLATVEKIFEIVESRLRSLSETNDSHNGRAATIFGFGGIILSIAFSIYAMGKPVMWLFILGIFFIFISLLMSIFAMKTREFWEDPHPRSLRDRYIRKGYKEVLEQVIANRIECYEHNLGILEKKARMVNYGFYCVFIGLCFLAFSVL